MAGKIMSAPELALSQSDLRRLKQLARASGRTMSNDAVMKQAKKLVAFRPEGETARRGSKAGTTRIATFPITFVHSL